MASPVRVLPLAICGLNLSAASMGARYVNARSCQDIASGTEMTNPLTGTLERTVAPRRIHSLKSGAGFSNWMSQCQRLPPMLRGWLAALRNNCEFAVSGVGSMIRVFRRNSSALATKAKETHAAAKARFKRFINLICFRYKAYRAMAEIVMTKFWRFLLSSMHYSM